MKKVIRWCFLLVFCSFIFFEYWYLLDNFVAFSIKGTKDGEEFILSSTSSNFISEWNDLLKCNFNVLTPISDWKEFIKYEGYELTGFIFGNDSYFAFLEKLKYIIGSVVVFVIVNIYRITVYKTFKNIKNYFKNRKDFVAYGYKKTIKYLKKFKNKIENSKDISKDDIIKMCKEYKDHKDGKIVCKPIFVSDLIDEILENTISERNDLLLYIPIFDKVISIVESIYYKEKSKIKSSNKFEEWFSVIIISFRYFSHVSREYHQYRYSINELYKSNIRMNYIDTEWFNLINFNFIFFIICISLPFWIILIYCIFFIINIDSSNFIFKGSLIVCFISFLFFQYLRCFGVDKKTDFLLRKKFTSTNFKKTKSRKKSLVFIRFNWIFILLANSLIFSLFLDIMKLNKLGYNLISEKYTPNWLSTLYIIFIFTLLISYAIDFIEEMCLYKKYTQKVIYKIWFIEFIVVILTSLIICIIYKYCTYKEDKEIVRYYLFICRLLLHICLCFTLTYRFFVVKCKWFVEIKNYIINKLNKIMRNKKIPIYNYEKTVCKEIGYFKNRNNEIQIKPLPKTIKKVPEVLPNNITSLKGAFEGNISKIIENLDKWDTSNITDMSYLFNETLQFNGDISNWDTSHVKNMECMFRDTGLFNQNINTKEVKNSDSSSYIAWNTSKVTNMNGMFEYALNFNQSLNNWDTSKVTNMQYMFANAQNFNQPIGNWDTSKVTNMNGMFEYALNFNQPIGNWDTSKVTNMQYMFANAQKFNQSLNNWDTSNVTNMECMFANTKNFNKPIGRWNTSKVTNMHSMFANAQNFNQNINTKEVKNSDGSSYIAWNTSNVTDMNFMFSNSLRFNNDISGWDFNSKVRVRCMFRYAKEFEKKLKILNPKKTKKALHLSGVKNYKKSRLEIIDKSIEGFSKIWILIIFGWLMSVAYMVVVLLLILFWTIFKA